MNGDSEDDGSDRDHAQEGQEPVGQSMKSLVTRGRQKEKKCGSKPYGPTVQWAFGVTFQKRYIAVFVGKV